MRILYVTSPHQDYLSDTILIGLLKGLSDYPDMEITEYPENRYIYKEELKSTHNLYGNGFSIYGLISTRSRVSRDGRKGLKISEYDLVIISDIHNQFGFFLQYFDQLDEQKTIILDGADTPALYPYSGYYWRRPYLWLAPRAHNKYLYFKRELTIDTIRYRYFKAIPPSIALRLSHGKYIRKISFSIPKEKIIMTIPDKTQLFQSHIVDEEIAAEFGCATNSYLFDDEESYYADLQRSKFGITTKRSGWDCMRHYEIAANAAVICFRDLHLKPETCAPHGLIDGVNCINYSNYDELNHKIESLTDDDYRKMQEYSIQWIMSKTCEAMAKYVLETQFELYSNRKHLTSNSVSP